MASNSKATPKIVGGRKSRRTGGEMVRTGRKPPKIVPEEPAQSMGYRFPDAPATPRQLAALRRLMVEYLRNHISNKFSDASVELLGELFGLQERQTKTVVSHSRSLQCTAEANLVLRVLHGMHTGEFAGILGTPKSQDNRWFFRLVYEFDLRLYRDELPMDLTKSFIPLPSDALLLGGGQTAQITDANGRDRIVNVWPDRDGTRWMEDPVRERDINALRMWHAAFRDEYRTWLRGDS